MFKQICFFRKHADMTTEAFMDYLVMMQAVKPIPVFRESDATGIRQS